MNLRASNGCFLTQVEDIPFEKRLFLLSVHVADIKDAAQWMEITEGRKKEMEDKNAFFSIDQVYMNFLHKMDSVLSKVVAKVNDAHLSNDESLEMQKYYPRWEDIIGKEVYQGYRFVCDDILFEVLEPHVVLEEMKPTMQVMTLSLMEEDNAHPSLYKKVLSSVEEEEYLAKEEEIDKKNINNQTKN